MIYQAYQAYADVMLPVHCIARSVIATCDRARRAVNGAVSVRRVAAANQLVALARLTHKRPAFDILAVTVGDREIAVTESVVERTAFCSLLHFKKEGCAAQPRVLLVAPLSGHFTTLLRGTVQTLLRDHDVYLTDWHNARDVSLMHGQFNLDDFIQHIIQFLEILGAGAHLVAVCQPTVAALAAVALMAADNNPAQPATMTLMAGPMDTRINPTKVNELATSKPIEWFERHLIGIVPLRYAGRLRRVYPGFVQLGAFMSMNLERHTKSFADLYRHLSHGDIEKAEPILTFYHEYFAMMDLPAEFYLQTIAAVFQKHLLPKGKLTFRGRLVEPRTIRRTALLTVEGEKDDICAVGQTLAAQDMCSGIRPYMKEHHMQPGVGHYGVFNGRRWETQIYPHLREFIHSHE
ncbi:MAG TPA: polyhydroxyalkanoate depolymerase [Burkholderiales bacterium]|nr:polyhydroxyalkanoate depolymerase [Burkholderiales bacterium]